MNWSGVTTFAGQRDRDHHFSGAPLWRQDSNLSSGTSPTTQPLKVAKKQDVKELKAAARFEQARSPKNIGLRLWGEKKAKASTFFFRFSTEKDQ
jgi:hypothetical protein